MNGYQEWSTNQKNALRASAEGGIKVEVIEDG